MRDHEERVYGVGKTKPTLADLKSQRIRLQDDLAQFMARKPQSTTVATLRQRIRALEGEIAAAEEAVRREKRAGEHAAEAAALRDTAEGSPRAATVRATTGRFPPRRR